MLALVVVLHGKDYYMSSIYPTVFAGGAVWIEWKVRRAAVRAAYTSMLAAVSLLLAPLIVPVLPVTTFIQYARALKLSPSESASERMTLGVLPQYFADMFGWKQLAEKVAAVYKALPPE